MGNKNDTCDLLDRLQTCNIDDVQEYTLCGVKTFGKIVDVYDGDTCKIILLNKNELQRFNCRLKSIDTPEMKPLKNKINRDIEIKNAIKCRNKLIELSTNCKINLEDNLTKKEIKDLIKTNTKVIPIQCYEFDKYGRLLVELYNENKIINNLLIESGYAKKYNGGAKEEFFKDV